MIWNLITVISSASFGFCFGWVSCLLLQRTRAQHSAAGPVDSNFYRPAMLDRQRVAKRTR